MHRVMRIKIEVLVSMCLFVSIIKDITLSPGDIMVSFDVCSLFTNVPIDEALKVILEMLSSEDYNSLSPDKIRAKPPNDRPLS